LADVLSHHLVRRRAQNLKEGWDEERSPWLCVTDEGTPLDESRVRKAFASVIKKAALPTRFTPHSLAPHLRLVDGSRTERRSPGSRPSLGTPARRSHWTGTHGHYRKARRPMRPFWTHPRCLRSPRQPETIR